MIHSVTFACDGADTRIEVWSVDDGMPCRTETSWFDAAELGQVVNFLGRFGLDVAV